MSINSDIITICGLGYVGSAMASLCTKNDINFHVCDTDFKQGNFNHFFNISDTIKFVEKRYDLHFIFICVPTPSDLNGNCDISIVESILLQIQKHAKKETYVIIKSTLVPGSCLNLDTLYPELNIILFPEFLTEKNYLSDVYNAKFALLGVSDNFSEKKYQKVTDVIKKLYQHNTSIDIIQKNYTECELFKYTVNNFLAVKVWYFNKIYDVSESLGIDYQNLKPLFELDPRISGYGTRVPGDHGRGFAGSCLLKEQRGLIKLLENLEIDNSVLKAISKENDTMRKL
jgi:UDPglucose 6-dehydrogenase